MKVIAWFKDGKPREVEIVPNADGSYPTVVKAIEYAKNCLLADKHELNRIDHFEVEEDFV